jgi:hypothetical protein
VHGLTCFGYVKRQLGESQFEKTGSGLKTSLLVVRLCKPGIEQISGRRSAKFDYDRKKMGLLNRRD